MIRVVLTGGGSGGHIYPLVAVADELKKIAGSDIEIFYLGPKSPFDLEFGKREIPVVSLLSSKIRRYASMENFLDIPKFFLSLVQAIFRLYILMPDVVFSKGGPGAFAVVLAARLYFIPVIIHESDAVPGLTNRLSSYFAKRIGVAFHEAASYFPLKKVAHVGNPVRSALLGGRVEKEEAKTQLGFNPSEPLILFLGGSQGAVKINNFLLENLGTILRDYQVYHQVGTANVQEAKIFFGSFEKSHPELAKKYRAAGYLDIAAMKLAFNAADIVVSRAGAGAIYEIAAFGKPAILIPLDGAANDHQRANAYDYSKSGAAEVVEEDNLKIHILIVEIKKILGDQSAVKDMSEKARNFFRPQAAANLAEEIIKFSGGSGK